MDDAPRYLPRYRRERVWWLRRMRSKRHALALRRISLHEAIQLLCLTDLLQEPRSIALSTVSGNLLPARW